MSNVSRDRVIRTYKHLLVLGRSYPKGYVYFRDMVKTAFVKSRDLNDPQLIAQQLEKADYLAKEVEALINHRGFKDSRRMSPQQESDGAGPQGSEKVSRAVR